jgi:hypothetical protein
MEATRGETAYRATKVRAARGRFVSIEHHLKTAPEGVATPTRA